jgi:hypothetical protein
VPQKKKKKKKKRKKPMALYFWVLENGLLQGSFFLHIASAPSPCSPVTRLKQTL